MPISSQCVICNKSDTSLLIQCDGCKKYLHAACASVDSDDAKRLTRQRSKGIKFFCGTCERVVDQFADLKSILSTISNRLDRLESRSELLSPSSFEKVVQESKERVQRENNIVVFGIAEDNSDSTIAANLANVLAPTENYARYITYTMRLGKKGDTARPLRVVFNNPYVVNDIIRLKKNLRSIDDYKRVFLKRDETNYQRDLYKKCQDELKQRKMNGEAYLRIKYVNGIPKIGTRASRSQDMGASASARDPVANEKND